MSSAYQVYSYMKRDYDDDDDDNNNNNNNNNNKKFSQSPTFLTCYPTQDFHYLK